MKNIIPFKKDVIFKTNLSEVTSISLENTLSIEADKIFGDFIISGEYKISDKSTSVEPFEIKLPFEIVMDERFDTKKATIDIDDFYYEIVNNNILCVSIDVLVDKLQERPIVELEDLVDVTPVREILESEDDIVENESIFNENDKQEETKEVKEEVRCIEEEEKLEDIVEKRDMNKDLMEEKMNSLFSQISKDSEVYVTYNVFILRDGDSLDTIIEKYGVTEEELKKYNDLSNLQLGDKIIVPNTYERD